MAGLFGGGQKAPPPPKPVRLPAEQDPDVLAAGKRTRASALARKGRMSTIMTSRGKEATGGGGGGGAPGSSGQKLGA